jgi:hypothetical protein
MAAATPAKTDGQPWSEKYRPKSLNEVASHKDIIDTSEQGHSHRWTPPENLS